MLLYENRKFLSMFEHFSIHESYWEQEKVDTTVTQNDKIYD